MQILQSKLFCRTYQQFKFQNKAFLSYCLLWSLSSSCQWPWRGYFLWTGVGKTGRWRDVARIQQGVRNFHICKWRSDSHSVKISHLSISSKLSNIMFEMVSELLITDSLLDLNVEFPLKMRFFSKTEFLSFLSIPTSPHL